MHGHRAVRTGAGRDPHRYLGGGRPGHHTVTAADALTGTGTGLGSAPGHIYWTDSSCGTVSKADLNGADPHAIITFQNAWGRWVGMSYDGLVITGWGAIARTDDEAPKIVQNLIDTGKP